MRTSDRLRMKGRVRFTVRDLDGYVTRCNRVDNVITNAWLNHLRDGYIGTTSDFTVRFLAWGDDATAAAATQTALLAEIGRKQVTQKTAGATGVVTIVTYVAPGDAVGETLEEWALFAGPVASLVMASRVLWNHAKTASESIQIEWQVTLAEAP